MDGKSVVTASGQVENCSLMTISAQHTCTDDIFSVVSLRVDDC